MNSSITTVTMPPASFCQGDSILLDAGYPGMNYSWSPGSQTTQTIYATASGSYSVTVTDLAGCSGNIGFTITTDPVPSANFNSSSTCEGNLMFFTNTSTITSGAITAWSWNFGDGTTSQNQNPSHLFAASGNYSVTLTVTSSSGCHSTTSKNVFVNPLPVPSFSPATSCIASGVDFINTSTVSSGSIASYNWNFGDGTGSTTQNPSHTFTTSGNYSVTLQVNSSSGCVQTLSQNITIHPQPSAAFTAANICLGNAVTFNNNSTIPTGTIASYDWDFNDSYTSTSQSPSHNFAAAGQYNIQLIVTSAFGCKDTIFKKVKVFSLPVASAGFDQTVCYGSSVVLTANGGNTYSWTPGGSTSQTVTITPASTTNYSVTVTDINGCTSSDNVNVYVNPLPNAQAGSDQSICNGSSAVLNGLGGLTYTWNPGNIHTSTLTVNPTTSTQYLLSVTDANGCSDTDSVTITVNQLPNVSAGPDNYICSGSTTSLTATGAVNYQWNPVGLNSATILVTPTANAVYTVTGTDSNGCVSSDTVLVNVLASPVVNFTPVFICPGASATIDAGNPGSSYSWSTGEVTQTISVSDSGTYTVIVTAANGCPDFASTDVSIGNNLSGPPTTYSICAGQSATLNAGNPGSSYHWSNGATTQTISVANGGTYAVTITGTDGCSATTDHIVTVNALPTASVSVQDVCSGTASVFTQNATVSSGTVQNFQWNFGDGNTSSAQSPAHVYSGPSNYNVTLTVTSSFGCSATFPAIARVHEIPQAAFSSATTCSNQSVLFNNSSTVVNGSIASNAWTFGDGSTSNASTPSHSYPGAGSYTASLITTSSFGCTASVSHTASVTAAPDASFSASNTCENRNVLINNTTSSNGSGSLNYAWNFGNGNTSSAFNPSINYNTDGVYNITLVVTASNGCVDSTIHALTIFPKPVASFTANPSCQGNAIQFTNTSNVSSGIIQSVYWAFGDNSTSNTLQPSHTYSSSGNMNVSLLVISNSGCSDTVNQHLEIYPSPQPAFTSQDVCIGTAIAFQNNSSISTGTLNSWNWTFGDGSSSSSSAPSHQYNNAGNFSVTLTAVSDHACTASATQSVIIFPNPVSAFITADVCLGTGTQFVNQSYSPDGAQWSSEWNFDGADHSSDASPVYEFTTAGSHTAALTVTSSHGCVSSITNVTDVHMPPTTRFTAPDNCAGSPIAFTNTSSSQDGAITHSLWTFGDGTSSLETNPIHMYADSGQYNVELMSITEHGCTARFSDTVAAFSHPTVAMNIASACEGLPVQFSATSNVTANMQYQWTVGNQTATSPSFNHTFTSAGLYSVALTATSSTGCSASTTQQFRVYANPAPDFSTNETCLSSPTTFTNLSTVQSANITSYSWSFGDNQHSTQFNAPHTYSAAGTYNVTLTATSDQGCSSTITKLAVVHPNPSATFNAGVQGCAPVNATFISYANVTSGNVVGYLWNFGDGDVATDRNPNHVYHQTGNYDVTLTVVSDFGCQGTSSQPDIITVFPQPIADFTVDQMVVDAETPVVHFENNSRNYQAFSWNFGDGTTSSDLNPTHSFADTGTYNAMLITTNNFGCKDTLLKSIEVKLHSTLFAANCFTPNGDGNNDVFKPYYTNMANIQVAIFDRWGKLLTSWDGLNGTWDGYYQGRKCQQDTYVYKITGTGLDGKYSEWVGHVSIVY